MGASLQPAESLHHFGVGGVRPARATRGTRGKRDGAARPGCLRALQILEEMQARHIALDVITFNAAVSACGKWQQWQRALQLMEKMQARRIAAIQSTGRQHRHGALRRLPSQRQQLQP